MRDMYASRVECDDSSTFSCRKGHESVITASSGFKGSCDYCNKPGHKQAQCVSNFCASLAGDLYLHAAQEESFGVVCITHTFTTTPTAMPSSNGVATAINTVTAVALARAEPTRQSYPTVRLRPFVGCPGFCSVYSRCCSACSNTAPPTPVASQAALTPYFIEFYPSGIGYSFLAGSTTPGPLKFAMTLGYEASSHFIDNELIGDIELLMKGIVKIDPPPTIVVAGHSTLRGVSIGTLTVRATDAQGFLHDMLLPTINVPGLGRRPFSGGTTVLEGINRVIVKESYLDVSQFKIPLHKDTECPTPLELASRGDYQTGASFLTRVALGRTILTGSTLASTLLSGHGGGPPSCNSGTSVYRNIYGGARSPDATDYSFSLWRAPDQWWQHGGGFDFHSDYVFAAPTITPGLVTATTIATLAMPTAAMAAVRSEYLAPPPGTSRQKHLTPAPRASERAYHAVHAEHRRDGSRLHRLADRVGH